MARVNHNSVFSPIPKEHVLTVIYAKNLVQGFNVASPLEAIMAHTEVRMIQDIRIEFITENKDVTPEALRHYFIESKQIPAHDTALDLQRIDAILARPHLLTQGQQVLIVLATRVVLTQTGFKSSDQQDWARAIREGLQGARFRFVFSNENDLSVEEIKNILEIRIALEQEGMETDIVQNILDRLLIEETAHDKLPARRGGGGHGVEFTFQGVVVNDDGTLVMPRSTVGKDFRDTVIQAGQRVMDFLGVRRVKGPQTENPWKGQEKRRAFLREHMTHPRR